MGNTTFTPTVQIVEPGRELRFYEGRLHAIRSPSAGDA